ncbi:LacI family DNA-binding transcriptional regulator [Chitinimonas sp. BJYL2]|uniref:LacI family DNA-binding transcriptional regulator n=1 Tax=Chitinimonas sp. BJYL2 TaxID=2976696 RepID=UPI0022B38C31|nr:LacI family DNA-binding transcriptional regulator [Chitinimonas sp. BJYL2]
MAKSPSSATPTHDGVVTLGMVAQASGVSPSTVSRILNGTAVVSPEKRAAVDKAIAELGYVPNPIARGLAGGRTMSIGVVTQFIDSPFYGVALRGIEETLGAAGYSALFVSGHWKVAVEQRCIDTLLSRRVDGMIILSGRMGDNALRTLAKKLPTVVTGRSLKGPGLYAMDFDHREGARLATQHLIARGHRDIAHISGDPGHPDARERLAGYQDALAAAGIAFRPELVEAGDYQEDSGRLAAERLLASRRNFTALFAANDQMAFGAAVSLHKAGLRIPQDVSLMGVDDLLLAAHMTPPLTTVHQASLELGCMAAQAMLTLLAGNKPDLQLPAPRLVERDSVASIARQPAR